MHQNLVQYKAMVVILDLITLLNNLIFAQSSIHIIAHLGSFLLSNVLRPEPLVENVQHLTTKVDE